MHIDLFSIADELYNYLTDHGIRFNSSGYPIMPSDMLLRDIPDEIIPFEHRNAAVAKDRAVLCHFANDELLYRRVKKYKEDTEILRDYMGVTGFDLSPRISWDIRKQRFHLLLNRMIDAYRIINKVYFMPNFRTGLLNTLDSVSYPPGTMYAVGSLGCARGNKINNEVSLRTKLLYLRPSMLLIYGNTMQYYLDILNDFGQAYKVFPDFKKMSFMKNSKECLNYGYKG